MVSGSTGVPVGDSGTSVGISVRSVSVAHPYLGSFIAIVYYSQEVICWHKIVPIPWDVGNFIN